MIDFRLHRQHLKAEHTGINYGQLYFLWLYVAHFHTVVFSKVDQCVIHMFYGHLTKQIYGSCNPLVLYLYADYMDKVRSTV